MIQDSTLILDFGYYLPTDTAENTSEPRTEETVEMLSDYWMH